MKRYPCVSNPRMMQILRHAGVRAISVAPDRVVIKCDERDGEDPLTRLLMHLEPSAVRGHEHMPSVEEMQARGLVDK